MAPEHRSSKQCEHHWNEPDAILGGIVCRKCGAVKFEQRASNPLRERLREWAQAPMYALIRRQLVEAADEIERLTAELAEARKPRLPVEPSPLPLVRELMAERDRLAAEVERLQYLVRHHQQFREESERLRAALERIDRFSAGEPGRIAREALAGAPDETES